ncbi:two-component system response regulator PrrA [Rhodococcus sp. OK519]|uniref:response regulator transcription factor n=1 Tax=Rhodococcus sp. OK519 TaxID=2135729 RepID=UPI000D3DC15A|nr:two-component system response regulator PrrA [Rhodococcus sp. OK519]
MSGTASIAGHNAQVTTTATVLVVDDDPDVLASLERGLRLSGFTVLTASDGSIALRVVSDASPDAVVLDMNMPVLDGTGVVTALRAAGNDVPICVLSARSSVDDRIAGLESGADDYLVKPFVLAELVARIRAMLRRRAVVAAVGVTGTPVVVGPLSVDVSGRRVWLRETEIPLTKREFELVEVLTRNAGVVLSRERLLDLVWGYDFVADTNVVDVFVGYLRRKFEADGTPRLVHTVRGVGFVLREQT